MTAASCAWLAERRASVDAAFQEIRQAGSHHPAIIIHMLRTIARIAVNVRLPSQRDALFDHATIIAEVGRGGTSEASDIADIDLSFQAVKIALK